MVISRACTRLVLYFSLFFPFFSRAVVKGSETAVSVEPTATFLAADNDNTMLGFGWFKNGFTLEDSSTTCTFNCVYPVSGDITFNGGTLCLAQNLKLQDVANLQGSADILGHDYSLEFCSSITELSATYTFRDITLVLDGDLVITDTIFFDGSCLIDGRGYHISFDGNGTIIANSGSTLALKNLGFDDISGVSVSCADDTAQLTLYDVLWHQCEDFTFGSGSILFDHYVKFGGNSTFFYNSSQTSTIAQDSCWEISDKLEVQIGRQKVVDYVEPLCFSDETSVMKLNDCSLVVTASGIGLTKGVFDIDCDVWIDVVSSTSTNGLIIGTGLEEDDFAMRLYPAANIHLTSGCWVYNNFNSVDKLNALSNVSRCVRYADSKFYVMKDWTIPPMVFQIASGSPQNVVVDGVTLAYDDTNVVFSGASLNVSGQEKVPGFKLRGNESLFMNKGALSLPLYVSGTGNTLNGNGKITGSVILQDSSSALTCYLDGSFLEDVVLNGGTLILSGNLTLDSDSVVTGSGVVNLSEHVLFSSADTIWNSDIEWESNGGALVFDANVDLNGTWTFSGNCIINGLGHNLDLNSVGRFVVEDDSKLTLRNITIHFSSADSITCLTDSSCIEFDNVALIHGNDLVFDKGSLLVRNTVDFSGSYSFVYDSAQTSTISERSRWIMRDGIVFEVGRKEAFDWIEPLYFGGDTSVLEFEGSSLVITESGLCFTRGRIETKSDVFFSFGSTTTTYSFMMGDGQEAGDFVFQIGPASNVHVLSGCWTYNNTIPGNIKSSSEDSRCLFYGSSIAYVAKSWVLPPMVIEIVSTMPENTVAPGATLQYNDVRVITVLSEFHAKAKEEPLGFSLNGNDFIYMAKGDQPLPLYITGNGNTLHGNGNQTGPIIFLSPTADLTVYLNGSLSHALMLNGATFVLYDDILFKPGASITGPGTISLSYNTLILGMNSCNCVTDTKWQGTNGKIDLNVDVDLHATWTFDGDVVIEGNGNMLNLNSTGELVVTPDSKLTLKNVVVRHVSGNCIRCLNDDASIELDNVTWVQDDNFTFTTGSLLFSNQVDFVGSYSFVYDSSRTSTVSFRSTWEISDDMVLVAGKKESIESPNPIYFADDSSMMCLENCSFIVTSSGLDLRVGRIKLRGDVSLEMLSSTTDGGLVLGSGSESDDITVMFDSGATLNFKKGWLVYNQYASNAFIAASESSQLIRWADSKIYVQESCAFPRMGLRVKSGLPTSTVAPGKLISYESVILLFENAEFDFKGYQLGPVQFSLEGDDYVSMTKGNILSYLYVSGIGNELRGTGDVSGPIILQDADTELTCQLNGTVFQSIAMNEGKIILSGDLRLGADVSLSGEGEVNLQNNRVVLGPTDHTWTGTMAWTGNGGTIELGSKVALHGEWNFKGSCVINGNGNVLDLNGLGNIKVDAGATIVIKNMRLFGISGDQIKCVDGSSNIVLENVTWVQDDDFVFSEGALQWKYDIKMTGTQKFVYKSGQVSTIAANSTLRLDSGFTFSYDPSTTASKNLITFEDKTSVLSLQGATFHTTVTGINLCKGKLLIESESFLSSEVVREYDIFGKETIIDEGITFGDGTAVNDMICEIGPGARLNVIAGTLAYKNVSSDSWSMCNTISNIYFSDHSRILLHESLNLGVGGIFVCAQAGIDIADGKELLGSMFMV